jgi:hypothetical protein
MGNPLIIAGNKLIMIDSRVTPQEIQKEGCLKLAPVKFLKAF